MKSSLLTQRLIITVGLISLRQPTFLMWRHTHWLTAIRRLTITRPCISQTAPERCLVVSGHVTCFKFFWAPVIYRAYDRLDRGRTIPVDIISFGRHAGLSPCRSNDPTNSVKALKEVVVLRQASIPQGPPHRVTNLCMHTIYSDTQYTNESKHSEMGPVR